MGGCHLLSFGLSLYDKILFNALLKSSCLARESNLMMEIRRISHGNMKQNIKVLIFGYK